MTAVLHPSLDERSARGRAVREQLPPSAHAAWSPAPDRPDPIALLEQQNTTRHPDLVPIRHGRMLVSPFTFYRGAAKVMAADLAGAPASGLNVQLCGDAHLSNFGAFASPERALVFGLNDFDETLPGPFEYDVKRMAASFVIAARNNGFARADARAIASESVAAYRLQMAKFAEMRTLDVWYAQLSEEQFMRAIKETMRALGQGDSKKATKSAAKSAVKQVRKAHTRDSLQALSKLAEHVDGRYRIVSQPPTVIPLRDLAPSVGLSVDQMEHVIHEQFRSYRETLQDDRRHLLEQFEVVDMAHKIVGVGSVGMRAFIVLLQGRDQDDPLFLQVKEATTSVLEDHLPKSRYRHPGQRVVQGQRLMQSASDIFLGWTTHAEADRHLYWRQLRDMKGSALVETMVPTALTFYAQICGETLARAHARSGDPVALAAYMGKKDRFERAITDFSERYADQNERDHQAFAAAIGSGRLAAAENP